MTRIAWTLALLVAAAAARADAPGATPAGGTPGATPPGEIRGALPPPRLVPLQEGGKAIPRGAVLEEVIGTVREVDRAQHRITIETAAGVVTLSLDRNTLVYGPGGLGTVLDLAPGSPVRAGRNADMKAYWVTVRAPRGARRPAPRRDRAPGRAAAPAARRRGRAVSPAPRCRPRQAAGRGQGRCPRPAAPGSEGEPASARTLARCAAPEAPGASRSI